MYAKRIFVLVALAMMFVFIQPVEAQEEICPGPEPCVCQIQIEGDGIYGDGFCAFGLEIFGGGAGTLTSVTVTYDPDTRCSGNNHGFTACWAVSSIGIPTPEKVVVYLGYTDDQVFGLDETKLRPFAFDSSWHPGAYIREVDTDGNVLIARFLTDWYQFWFGAAESPTAISLVSFSAVVVDNQPDRLIGLVVLAFVLLLIGGYLFVWHYLQHH